MDPNNFFILHCILASFFSLTLFMYSAKRGGKTVALLDSDYSSFPHGWELTLSAYSGQIPRFVLVDMNVLGHLGNMSILLLSTYRATNDCSEGTFSFLSEHSGSHKSAIYNIIHSTKNIALVWRNNVQIAFSFPLSGKSIAFWFGTNVLALCFI